MRTSRRRLLALLASLPVLVVVASLLYMAGMGWLEGRPRGFWQSLEFVGETLSTTGYGADAAWHSPLMVLFVVLLQFLGVFLVFLIIPIFLIPYLEERFETRLPQELGEELSGHLVVYGYGPAVETLVEQTERAGLATVIVEEDEAVARRLAERRRRVVCSELDDGALEGARLGRARALIANGPDDVNAAVILAARQSGFAGDVLALVEEPLHRRPLLLAGATSVFTPRHVLGAALAARASARISPRVAGVQNLGRLEIHQVRVQPESSLAGQTLEQAAIGARTGAVVIGQWIGGELHAPPSAATRIEPGAILVIAGTDESVERLLALVSGAVPLRRRGRFVVGGCGEVGSKVVELLADAGESVLVVDRQASERVDVVGDMLDPKVVEDVLDESTQGVILALDTDAATLFATVIAKEAAPDVPVIARVNRAENVERIHLAGADFALSISQVSGQILARRLLREEAISVDPQLKVLKTRAEGRLAGHDAVELAIRERTGCSVVAVERGDELLLELAADFRFEPGDTVYVCGPVDAVRRFAEEFGAG
jgi:Trk K+ transport system NAD-binding subunit